MKLDKLKKNLFLETISIPKLLLCNYTKMGISDEELVVLIMLINTVSNGELNYEEIATSLNKDVSNVLECVNSLVSKNILEIDVSKDSNGIIGEKLSFDNLNDKLINYIIDDKESEESNIYETFEKEFGRALSPMEYEIINAWLDDNFTEEILVAALKEAIYNGITNLRYIDKIIYEWRKKGIKTAGDVKKKEEDYRKNKEEKKELFDYNWLEDNEESNN